DIPSSCPYSSLNQFIVQPNSPIVANEVTVGAYPIRLTFASLTELTGSYPGFSLTNGVTQLCPDGTGFDIRTLVANTVTATTQYGHRHKTRTPLRDMRSGVLFCRGALTRGLGRVPLTPCRSPVAARSRV